MATLTTDASKGRSMPTTRRSTTTAPPASPVEISTETCYPAWELARLPTSSAKLHVNLKRVIPNQQRVSRQQRRARQLARYR
jgi:hypothetical protein